MLGTSAGGITLVAGNLPRSGLVRRQRDAGDRRVVVVSLTEEGRQRLATVCPNHAAALVKDMRVLTAGEQETSGRLCRILGKQERE